MQTLHSTLLFAAFAALASLPTGAQAASEIICAPCTRVIVPGCRGECLVVAGLLNQLPNVTGIDCEYTADFYVHGDDGGEAVCRAAASGLNQLEGISTTIDCVRTWFG